MEEEFKATFENFLFFNDEIKNKQLRKNIIFLIVIFNFHDPPILELKISLVRSIDSGSLGTTYENLCVTMGIHITSAIRKETGLFHIVKQETKNCP